MRRCSKINKEQTMKKFVFILTAIMLCLCFSLFAACGTDNAGGANNNGGSGGNQTSGNTDNDGEGDDGDFVYYTVTFDSQGGSAVESEKVRAIPRMRPYPPQRTITALSAGTIRRRRRALELCYRPRRPKYNPLCPLGGSQANPRTHADADI